LCRSPHWKASKEEKSKVVSKTLDGNSAQGVEIPVPLIVPPSIYPVPSPTPSSHVVYHNPCPHLPPMCPNPVQVTPTLPLDKNEFDECGTCQATSYVYSQVLGSPPPKEWQGHSGIISIIIANLGILSGSRIMVGRVLKQVHSCNNNGTIYNPFWRKSRAVGPTPSKIFNSRPKKTSSHHTWNKA
jgi:hypothetical protein